MYKRNFISLSIVLLVLGFALAGCGGSESATNTPVPTVGPTDTPRPTSTPVPTIDMANLSINDLQVTAAALETSIAQEEENAAGASGEAEEGSAELNRAHFERKLEEVQELIEAAEMDSNDDGEAPMAAAITLSGDFEEARQWGWDELQELSTITATIVGPGEDATEMEYTGVSLAAFVEAAGVGADAETLVVTASDDYTVEIELAAVHDCAECMIVLEDDGSLHLIMPDFPSNNWVAGVVSLEVH
jgi:hypothetical protein